MENPFKELSDKLDRLQTSIDSLKGQKAETLPEDDITDVKGAAKILHATPGTIYNLVHNMKIPYFKRPGSQKLLFKKSELIRWIAFGRKKTKEEISEDINEKLSEIKRGQRGKEPPKVPSKERNKNKENSLCDIPQEPGCIETQKGTISQESKGQHEKGEK